jgi:hypothetical protein
MPASWWPLIAGYAPSIGRYALVAFSSPLLLWALASIFTNIQKRRERARAASRVVATQLDPLLKAADELQGKLRSLAEEDFAEFREIANDSLPPVDLVNLCSALYLFAQFWGRLEILRRESFQVELARNNQGRVLLRFLRCLESRRVRLVDRAWQRAIGESVVVTGQPAADVLAFKAFAEQYETTARLRGWFRPLENLLRETKYPRARERVLQYGVIVHALIDTLDPNHYTTKERPAYPNKLSRRAKRDLIGRVFDIYLTDVRRPEKYTGIQP